MLCLARNAGSMQQDQVGIQGHQLFASTSTHDRTLASGGKWTVSIQSGADVAGGWDVEYVSRQEDALNVLDGVPRLVAFGSDIEASVLRLAGYSQRDWDIGPAWAIYSGLRCEGITTTSTDALTDVHNESAVWSPILQSLRRPGDPASDGLADRPGQIRPALARTYRAPEPEQPGGQAHALQAVPGDRPQRAVEPRPARQPETCIPKWPGDWTWRSNTT